MKPQDKVEVIEAIVSLAKQPKERFKKLLQLLLDSPKSTPGQKRYYNSAGFSPARLSSIEYDLKKLYSISDKDLHKAAKTRKLNNIEVTKELPDTLLLKYKDLDIDNADYNKELKPLAKTLSELLDKKPESNKKLDLIAFIKANFKPQPSTTDLLIPVEKLINESPDEVKTSIKLRDQFPFLAEDDCPDEFKILIADKLTAYDKYLQKFDEVKAAVDAGATNEAIFEIAKQVVENFELNLDIYDELNYYNEHNQILGEHPIFADQVLTEKVNTYSTVDLTKRQKNLRTYISREDKTLEGMTDGPEKTKLADKVTTWKKELTLVDARLANIS